MFIQAALLSTFFSVTLACSSTLLPELERRARNYIADGTIDPYVNDFHIVDQWYDVTKYDQQYLMPDSKSMPDYFTCGGYEPIYIEGTHPDIKTLTSMPIDVTACLRSTFDTCDSKYKIKVRKCDKKVEYFLVPTKQHASYCFDPPEIQTPGKKFAVPPTDVALGVVVIKPKLKFDEDSLKIRGEDTINYTPYLIFECTFTKQSAYFYAVNWYQNGILYKVLGPTQNMEDLVISEKTMFMVDKIPLGFTLKCGVRVSKDKTGRATTLVPSAGYFAGIKILNPTVRLQKTSMATVELQVTVPVGCRYNSYSKKTKCTMGLSMLEQNGYTCNKANVVQMNKNYLCRVEIDAAKDENTWNYNNEVYHFNISTVDENYSDKSDYILQLHVISEFNHAWWARYEPDNIKVVVADDKIYQKKTCYAHVDPHMQTADGYTYECQEKGEYLMYRNKQYNIEVRTLYEKVLMKTDTCNNGIAQCICSLIIRAGADVFNIDTCGKPKVIVFLSCIDGGILKVQKKHERHYQVHTPIATYIDIVIHGPGDYDRFMNVDISPAPKDKGKMEGLCGYMDGDRTNDLTKRNGDVIKLGNEKIYPRYHPDFIKDWRLKDEENLFRSYKKENLKRWKDINAMYCVCNQSTEGKTANYETLCYPTQYLDCHLTFPTETSKMCNIETNKRKKRSVQTNGIRENGKAKHQREIERLLKLIHDREDDAHHIERRGVAEQNISSSEARAHCENVVNGSYVVSELSDALTGEGSNAVIEQCIFDVLAGNDLSLADVHLHALNNMAQTTLKRDPVYAANNTERVEVFIRNSCPGNCTQNGKCSEKGECECDDHFKGADCSLDERDPVTIDDLEGGGLCNLTDGDGCECFFVRTGYLLPNFTCALSGVITYIDGTEENITETFNNGVYENMFTGQCCAPAERHKRSTSERVVFSTRYDIAVSNDGQNFGSAEPLHVFDSVCQDALPDNEYGHRIVLKTGFCFIDGVCIGANETRVSDRCFTCEANVSMYNWTKSCQPTDTGAENLGVILGTTFGSVAGVMAAVGIFSIWHFKFKPKYKKRKSVGNSQIFSNTAVESMKPSQQITKNKQ